MRRAGLLFLLVAAAACSDHNESKPAPATDAPAKAVSSDLATLPGIDLNGLDPSQVKALDHMLDEKPSPCGKSQSLRAALKTDPGCRRAVFAARYLVAGFRAGGLPTEVDEQYDKRFVSPEMGQCDVANAPMRGNPNAPVTLCEFYDFQCPHCKLVEPILEKLLEEYPTQVKLYAKNYPISKLHPDATDAAAAAVAAGKQGKFWQMHDKIFANQEKLSAADLERYATELKLDVKKWKADLPAAREAVEKDHAEGEKLGIDGTPTIYINGRKYSGPLRYEFLKDWIDEELNR